MDLQDQYFHVLQQLIDGVDVGVGQLKALDLGLGDSWVSQLFCTHTTRMSSPALPRLAQASSGKAADGKKKGQLFCSHALRAGSPAPTTTPP